MEMRTAKIQNFLETAKFQGVADLWVVQYEFLLANGTQSLLDRIHQFTGVQPNCKPKDPQNRPRKPGRVIEPEFAKFVRQHIDWTVEAMVGYEPQLRYEEKPADW